MDGWAGFAERDDGSVVTCEIVHDDEGAGVWLDGCLRDDIATRGDLVARCRAFYDSLSDRQAGRALTIDEVWPEGL